MRIANLAGRAVLLTEGGAIDVHKASGGALSCDPQELFDHWEETRPALAALSGEPLMYAAEELRAPVPRPRQIFAIGVNYRDHADEADLQAASTDAPPPTFTKFASSLTGPVAHVKLPEGWVDWEVELVVVIGRGGHRIAAESAWDHVAGLTVGQDLSERLTQWSGPSPQQFSLGKSYPGFAPTGPAVVTLDEIPDPADLRISCTLNGETMQDSRTSEMIFDVPALIARLSAITTRSCWSR